MPKRIHRVRTFTSPDHTDHEGNQRVMCVVDESDLDKIEASPFIALPLNPPGGGLEAWKNQMQALAEEMHKRSHEIDKSYGKLPGPACADYVDFVHSLHDALAYFYNCNSEPGNKFLEFDKQELANRLRWSIAALERDDA